LVSDQWGGSEKGDGELERREGSFKADNDGSVKGGQDRGMGKVDKEGSTKSGKGTPRKHKSSNQNKGPVPKLFWLSEKPMCSFRGHTEDILDLSWSRSQVCFFRDWILLISQLGLHDMLTQTIFLSRCCVVFAFTPN
jgi:hypothetical protein